MHLSVPRVCGPPSHSSMVANLHHYAEVIPTTSKQLSIIANVKAATPSDTSVSSQAPLQHAFIQYSLCHCKVLCRIVLAPVVFLGVQAELMLGRNSANLMKNVVEAIQAAESACVKVHTYIHAYAHQPCEPTCSYSTTCLWIGWSSELD